MSKTLDKLVSGGGWRTVMDFGDARFFRHVGNPEVYMRIRKREDGSTETRYAWDGDGVVTPSLTDIARAIDAEVAGG